GDQAGLGCVVATVRHDSAASNLAATFTEAAAGFVATDDDRLFLHVVRLTQVIRHCKGGGQGGGPGMKKPASQGGWSSLCVVIEGGFYSVLSIAQRGVLSCISAVRTVG